MMGTLLEPDWRRSWSPWRTHSHQAFRIRHALIALGLAASAAPAWAQVPVGPSGYCDPRSAPQRRVGPLRRMYRHVSYTLHDRFVGDPALFVEPPLGFSLRETQGIMTGRAELHRFTFYRSDFVAGSTELSPAGLKRINLMAQRLPGWLGPVWVEWVPEQPQLAEARKSAVLEMLQRSNPVLTADRVVIAPSPFRGLIGAEAANNFDTVLTRSQAAGRTYSLTPTTTTDFGGGPR